MKLSKLVLVISFLLFPAAAFAWGPLTHIYLGNELFSLGVLLPAGVLELIRRYRKDFLYGNIMADIIIGKKYLPDEKCSHSWEVGFDLLQDAGTAQQKAFVYGYLSHLAADTVAHNSYTVDRKNIGHTLLEMKADSIIDKKYWVQALSIDRKTQMRNDLFLENSLERFLFSFKTNKRIFKGMVFFSVFNQERVGDFIDRRMTTSLPDRDSIEVLHQESLDKMIDLLQNFESSDVVTSSPSGSVHKGRFARVFLQVQQELESRRFLGRP
ncbi:MAG TPA: zinc dependent phospholipase C family protein [Thermodesulfovibrionales bacterium]|nr:zinc dependent phospholipase C family protein [Thermodesulfovibrionales bacterium]